ncbi:hypothetical protein AB9F47_21520 [Rhizobium leguminosarum]|uniref:hypothetical protein n=1 Tax=Rhizobium leguminosarum TaxID=384 RepID=UPI003F9D0340
MKTENRNFVVEFKSGRRRSPGKTNSIWGNTDLKALAREVEQKAPHLFAGVDDDAVSDHCNLASSNHVGVELPPIAARPEAVTREPEAPDHVKETFVLEDDQLLAAQKAAVSREMDLPQRHAAPGAGSEKLTTTISDGCISPEELLELERENKRLLRLLYEKLFSENVVLKKLIARFGEV